MHILSTLESTAADEIKLGSKVVNFNIKTKNLDSRGLPHNPFHCHEQHLAGSLKKKQWKTETSTRYFKKELYRPIKLQFLSRMA